MNKTEFINAISKRIDLPKKHIEACLHAFTEIVKEEVAKETKVQLIGFGTFEARERKARTGKNPQTGKDIKIPAKKTPAFKAGLAFKKQVMGK